MDFGSTCFTGRFYPPLVPLLTLRFTLSSDIYPFPLLSPTEARACPTQAKSSRDPMAQLWPSLKVISLFALGL